MSLLSRITTTALVAGSLVAASNSYALQLFCGPTGYVLQVDSNPANGYYDVACTNGYASHAFTFYANANTVYTFPGNFKGNVTCTLTGVYSVTVASFCS